MSDATWTAQRMRVPIFCHLGSLPVRLCGADFDSFDDFDWDLLTKDLKLSHFAIGVVSFVSV